MSHKCPHCMTELHQDATVCTGCGAKYGYKGPRGTILYKQGMEEAIKTNKRFVGILFVVGVVTIPVIIGILMIGTALGNLPELNRLQNELNKGPSWYK